MHKAANAYMQTQVTTTTPGHLVVMLYDGAITFLEQAKGKLRPRIMPRRESSSPRPWTSSPNSTVP